MTSEVLLRKLTYMRQLLIDLAPYEGATLAQVRAEHYKLERLFELLVMAASDLLFHELTDQGVTPASYRDAFRLAGVHGLLPVELADRLQQAAGMRNVIVHLYQGIDYAILRDSIGPALRDFGQLVSWLEAQLDQDDSESLWQPVGET
jgi:uncharacterized protein YutE (UPF0331/DUF86 family)